MNKQELYELLRLDPNKVPDEVEFWALYATTFYEKLFSKMNDPEIVEQTYERIKHKMPNRRASEALEFFYQLRLDELETHNYWHKVGNKNIGENMKAKLVKESLNESVGAIAGGIINESLNESVSRYCDIYKTQDGKWYMDLANEEYGEYDDCTTYGPFSSEEAADKYLSDNHSNPGGGWVDDSGEKPVPTESPNGRKIVNPRSGGGGRMMMGGYGRRW